MRLQQICLGLLAVSLIGGCTRLPDLDETVTPAAKAAPYPALVPLDPLLVDHGDSQTTLLAGSTQAQRAAALRDRAARMRAASGQ